MSPIANFFLNFTYTNNTYILTLRWMYSVVARIESSTSI